MNILGALAVSISRVNQLINLLLNKDQKLVSRVEGALDVFQRLPLLFAQYLSRELGLEQRKFRVDKPPFPKYGTNSNIKQSIWIYMA